MRDMRRLVRNLADGGITIVLSSHLLVEVEELCNRVAIVGSGKIIYEGALSELIRSGAGRYRLRTTDNDAARLVCERQAGVADVRTVDGALDFAASEDAVAALSVALVESRIAITALTPQAATLEELFFRLTEGDGQVSPEVEMSGEESR
jgi:ABC-2 type transport system ATP-binding protein